MARRGHPPYGLCCSLLIYRRCHGIDENPGQGVIAGVNDTGDEHKIANISVGIFEKFEMAPIGGSWSSL